MTHHTAPSAGPDETPPWNRGGAAPLCAASARRRPAMTGAAGAVATRAAAAHRGAFCPCSRPAADLQLRALGGSPTRAPGARLRAPTDFKSHRLLAGAPCAALAGRATCASLPGSSVTALAPGDKRNRRESHPAARRGARRGPLTCADATRLAHAFRIPASLRRCARFCPPPLFLEILKAPHRQLPGSCALRSVLRAVQLLQSSFPRLNCGAGAGNDDSALMPINRFDGLRACPANATVFWGRAPLLCGPPGGPLI